MPDKSAKRERRAGPGEKVKKQKFHHGQCCKLSPSPSFPGTPHITKAQRAVQVRDKGALVKAEHCRQEDGNKAKENPRGITVHALEKEMATHSSILA